MLRFFEDFLIVALALALSLAVLVQSIEVYRVQHRPAAELLAVAESALAADGQVTLDARTATLILNGTHDGVRRALALLRQLDQPLSSVILEQRLVESSELETLDARIAWKASLGPLHVGTLPLPGNALFVSLGAERTRARTTTAASLRLLEGSDGVIATGRALPVLFEPYWGTVTTGYVPVETGFEARATVLGPDRDRVRLELRPFAGRIGEHGELQYIAAATVIEVQPGETVVVGETSSDTTSSITNLNGVGRERREARQLLLISVEIEQ